MTSGADFTLTVRSGRRCARATLVVHLARGAAESSPTQVGFVVSRSVGGSVTRHRVTRRLRHQVAALLAAHPDWRAGLRLVVRALPPAASASSARLHDDLQQALTTAAGRLAPAVSIA